VLPPLLGGVEELEAPPPQAVIPTKLTRAKNASDALTRKFSLPPAGLGGNRSGLFSWSVSADPRRCREEPLHCSKVNDYASYGGGIDQVIWSQPKNLPAINMAFAIL